MKVQLKVATMADAEYIQSWFTSEQTTREWSGPNFRYPFTQQSFLDDLQLSQLNGHVLLSEDDEILAFGQFYLRLGRCHLGRLVVNPVHRGQGIATELIRQLIKLGEKKLQVSSSSLFVYEHNSSALNAYHKYGFKLANYPEEMPMEGIVYMVKETETQL